MSKVHLYCANMHTTHNDMQRPPGACTLVPAGAEQRRAASTCSWLVVTSLDEMVQVGASGKKNFKLLGPLHGTCRFAPVFWTIFVHN
jgi:hypothetical protein